MQESKQRLSIIELLNLTRTDAYDYTGIVLPFYRAILDMATNHTYSPQALEHRRRAEKLIETLRDAEVHQTLKDQLSILSDELSRSESYVTTMNYIWLVIDSLE